MNTEHPVVEEKRTVLVFFHKGDGLLGHAVFDVLVRFGGIRVEILELPWCHITASGAGTGPMGEIHVEGVFEGRVGFRAEVPFSEVTRGVSGGLEAPGECLIGGVETADRFGHG